LQLMALAQLPPPSGDAGTDAPALGVSRAAVDDFFYDNLCCAKLGQPCASAGSPACCAPNVCVVPDGGTTTGTCKEPLCKGEGELCTRGSECCSSTCDLESGRCINDIPR